MEWNRKERNRREGVYIALTLRGHTWEGCDSPGVQVSVHEKDGDRRREIVDMKRVENSGNANG